MTNKGIPDNNVFLMQRLLQRPAPQNIQIEETNFCESLLVFIYTNTIHKPTILHGLDSFLILSSYRFIIMW